MARPRRKPDDSLQSPLDTYLGEIYRTLINRRYGVSGAQPAEIMLKALTAGWDEGQT